jgi:Flp pilus assembly protein TadD
MKLSLKFQVALALILLCFAAESRAQNANTGAREDEWQGYKLPASNFIRLTDSTKALAFRVPIEWKQQGSELNFEGPDAELKIVIEKIPDGIPLRAYVAALVQGLRGLPGGPDALLVRRTKMVGVEAREFVFEFADARGATMRRIIWTAVDGPRAVSFLFTTPTARATQDEPYFKAVIQSATLSDGATNAAFDLTYSNEFKENKPGRIDEVLALIEALDSIDAQARAKTISSLAKIFAAAPEAAIDLLNDRRPMIRAAAIDAIESSRNAKLATFLIDALDDGDSFVAERAAKGFTVLEPEFGKWMRNNISTWQVWGFQKILRASAYVDEGTRAQIAAALFKQPVPKKPPALPVPPAKSARKSTSVRATPPPIPDASEMAKAFPSGFIPTSELNNDAQMLAINLLRGISVAEFKMPLADIVARNDERAIVAALQVALDRRESLPVDALFKLFASSSGDVRWLTALSLAWSASAADIPRIESYIKKLSDDSKNAVNVRSDKRMDDELRLAIKKIRLREKIAAAGNESRSQLIKQALSDAELTAWAWSEYARDEIEGPRKNDAAVTTLAANQAARQQEAKPAAEILPFGENVFPENVTYYAALPDPSSALNKVGDALRGLQMETARSQADLVLILSGIRERIARNLDAPSDGTLLDYLGIKSNAPIALASWNAESAPGRVAGAERRAVVLRVSDRDRFERLLALYQKQFGNFASLSNYISIGARIIGIVPAFLPLSAEAILQDGLARPKDPTKTGFNLIGRDNCLGYPVKLIERREITWQGFITSDSIYLAYVGDAAVLAPDWYSLRDVLARLASDKPKLSGNAEFKKAVAGGGEAFYLSSLAELFESSAKKESGNEMAATESGALRISNAVWENSFQFSFKEGAWLKPLVQFHPSELSAPHDLLPRSAIIYYFMKTEAGAAWREWSGALLSTDDLKQLPSIWAVDFEKDVLSEIGPECGLALLGLPSFNSGEFSVPWMAFFKLKSDKLAQSLSAGKLLKGVPAGTLSSRVRIAGLDMIVTIKNGFLIFTGSEATLGRLDATEKLDAARDFTRAAKSAPAGIVAFGGYNLEAAIAEIKIPSGDPATAQAVGSMMSVARAFHSQNFYAAASAGQLNAHMSVSLDREGRYSVEEVLKLSKDYRLAFAIIEASGVPIVDQKRLESLKLRIRAKAAGEIDRVKEDITSPHQTTEKRSEQELILTVRPRRFAQGAKVQLPISQPELAEFLKPTRDIRSDDKSVIERAREIAGDDRDAWSVARKLSDWTYKNLKWKRVDYADAAQTLATREADCSEFSQLFVAMARSLGLPARIVTGIAYGDGSFGGHAWVEVYAGQWIELDPTYGTDFVDATHVRSSSNELLSYAALNLVQVEALEAVRGVPDFQRDVTSLVEKLCEELTTGEQNALTVALDAASLSDEYMGAGAWDKMNEREREQMFAAYRKALTEISSMFGSDEESSETLRPLKVSKAADRAEALVMNSSDLEEKLMRFKFVRRGDAWVLADLVQVDTGLHVISSLFVRPIQEMLDNRSGKKTQSKPMAALHRELLELEDSAVAFDLIEGALKNDPKNRSLRYLKAMWLLASDKNDDAVKLLTDLSIEDPPYAIAIHELAAHYQSSEEAKDNKRATELYERYATLEPDDPRPLTALGLLYSQAGDAARAEARYLAAIERDQRYAERYIDLAEFLATQHRYGEALGALDKGERAGKTKDELYVSLIQRFVVSEDSDTAEALVAAHPERLARNFDGNLGLARLRVFAGRPKDALPLYKKASEIKQDSADPHTGMAEAYRRLKNWSAAIAAGDAALRVDAKNAEAHYHRACALAQLGRRREALASLKLAVELEDLLSGLLEEEEDLKPLAGLAEFKKLIKKDDDK